MSQQKSAKPKPKIVPDRCIKRSYLDVQELIVHRSKLNPKETYLFENNPTKSGRRKASKTSHLNVVEDDPQFYGLTSTDSNGLVRIILTTDGCPENSNKSIEI